MFNHQVAQESQKALIFSQFIRKCIRLSEWKQYNINTFKCQSAIDCVLVFVPLTAVVNVFQINPSNVFFLFFTQAFYCKGTLQFLPDVWTITNIITS